MNGDMSRGERRKGLGWQYIIPPPPWKSHGGEFMWCVMGAGFVFLFLLLCWRWSASLVGLRGGGGGGQQTAEGQKAMKRTAAKETAGQILAAWLEEHSRKRTKGERFKDSVDCCCFPAIDVEALYAGIRWITASVRKTCIGRLTTSTTSMVRCL
ncbi:unnamed protein product [Prunus armeniaca]|uniref:Uncharacterized protein n=1 Tax=Prunus armeniaca TaxID=36596 RepID=A0A6J5UB21_PRUAR|nr:unnamed protein product [Prunus armeniaca]